MPETKATKATTSDARSSNATPTWVKDLRSFVDAIPYGVVELSLSRHKNQTVEIQTSSLEKVKHQDNETAIQQVVELLHKMEESGYDGSVTFSVVFKGGKIEEIGYYSVKQTRY